MFYWFAFYIIKTLGFFLCPFTVTGRENVPKKGGYIFASNHLSNLDPLILGLITHRWTSYMAKDSLFKGKIFTWILYRVGAFPIRRETADIRSLREAMRRLTKKGTPLVVFPEGTRAGVREDTDPDVQAGIGFLAAKSGVPVVPAYIFDSDKVLPPHAKRFYKHPVHVIVGKPHQFSPKDNYSEIAKKIKEEIFALAEGEAAPTEAGISRNYGKQSIWRKDISSWMNKAELWFIFVGLIINSWLIFYSNMQLWVWKTGKIGLLREMFRPIDCVGDNPFCGSTMEGPLWALILSAGYILLSLPLLWWRAILVFLLFNVYRWVPLSWPFPYLVSGALSIGCFVFFLHKARIGAKNAGRL